MKCMNTLFTKNGLLTNIANYILIFITISFLVLFFLFLKFGMFFINEDITKIINWKRQNKNQFDILNIDPKGEKKKKTIKIKNKPLNPLKKKRDYEIKNKNKNKKDKKKNSKSIKKRPANSFSKIELKNTNIIINLGKRQSNKFEFSNKSLNKNLNNIKNNIFQIYDSELNLLTYKEALILDKRTYINYYISLLKVKHPLLFSFIPYKDYNIIIIKISILILSFVIYCGINTLFFDDSAIHNIYENKGNYNINYHISKIIYSFFISHIICSLIKYLSLSERALLNIKYEIKLKNIGNKEEKVKRCLFIKYIIFYIIGLIFLIFFWFYLSCFCAVYKNSQIYPFINTLLCIILSLLYPFLINLIPGIFRIPSLTKKRNSEYLFKISKVIQYI